MKELIKCCEILMNERGSTLPVMGFVYGPLGILAMMRSAEKLFVDCLKYKEKVIKGCETLPPHNTVFVVSDADLDRTLAF